MVLLGGSSVSGGCPWSVIALVIQVEVALVDDPNGWSWWAGTMVGGPDG